MVDNDSIEKLNLPKQIFYIRPHGKSENQAQLYKP